MNFDSLSQLVPYLHRFLEESGGCTAGQPPDPGGGDAGEQGGGAAPLLSQEAGQNELALVQERPLPGDLQVLVEPL